MRTHCTWTRGLFQPAGELCSCLERRDVGILLRRWNYRPNVVSGTHTPAQWTTDTMPVGYKSSSVDYRPQLQWATDVSPVDYRPQPSGPQTPAQWTIDASPVDNRHHPSVLRTPSQWTTDPSPLGLDTQPSGLQTPPQ